MRRRREQLPGVVVSLLTFLLAIITTSQAFTSSFNHHRYRSTLKMATTTEPSTTTTPKPNEGMFNPLLAAVTTSKTIEMHAMTKALEAQGEKIVSLCVGEPDFPPPPGKGYTIHITSILLLLPLSFSAHE